MIFLTMDKLGKFIQNELQKRNWTQADLSRIAGMNESVVSNLINGQRRLGITSVVNLAAAFGVTADSLLRAAGLLPSVPESTAEIELLVHRFNQLSDADKTTIMRMMEVMLDK